MRVIKVKSAHVDWRLTETKRIGDVNYHLVVGVDKDENPNGPLSVIKEAVSPNNPFTGKITDIQHLVETERRTVIVTKRDGSVVQEEEDAPKVVRIHDTAWATFQEAKRVFSNVEWSEEVFLLDENGYGTRVFLAKGVDFNIEVVEPKESIDPEQSDGGKGKHQHKKKAQIGK